MEKILACLDFSAYTEEVIQTAIKFRKKSDEYELYFLTVVNSTIEYFPADMGMFTDPFEARQHNANNLLRKVKEMYPQYNVHTISCVGDPKQAIIKAAERIQADMIIIGTHGRTGWEHTMMGSNAEYVVRHATVPVLSVPYKKNPH